MDSLLQLLFLKEKPVIKHSAADAKILTGQRKQELHAEREKNKQLKTHTYIQDLNNCYDKINNSINNGQYDCLCESAEPKQREYSFTDRISQANFSLDDKSVKALQDNGYTVNNEQCYPSKKGGPVIKTRVSWL